MHTLFCSDEEHLTFKTLFIIVFAILFCDKAVKFVSISLYVLFVLVYFDRNVEEKEECPFNWIRER